MPKTNVKVEVPVSEDPEEVVGTPAVVQTKPVEVKPEVVVEPAKPTVDLKTTVDIFSADGRTLECAINEMVWKGKRITIPAELEGEIRGLLERGGYLIRQ